MARSYSIPNKSTIALASLSGLILKVFSSFINYIILNKLNQVFLIVFENNPEDQM